MTQKLGGGGSKLKYKVKDVGTVIIYDSKPGWNLE